VNVGAVENVKEVAEFIKKFNDIELNRRILNLENEVLDLSRAKRYADEKIEELERTLRFKEKLTFRGSFYYLEGDFEPFCPGCWDSKRIAAHLGMNVAFPSQKQCPVCKHIYGG
jgi:hypothetical protein